MGNSDMNDYNSYNKNIFYLLIYSPMGHTIENLAKAFTGESQARNRYTIYASIARKEGYLQISEIFLATAEQEKEHAEWFFKMLQLVKEKTGDTSLNEIDIPTTTVSKLGDTLTNLETAIAGEHHEEADLYPMFAQVAQDEGHPEVAARIRSIIKAEIHHEERYTKLHEQLKAGSLYKKPQKIHRVCSKCGYVIEGEAAPLKCPSCDHEQNYFQVLCETY